MRKEVVSTLVITAMLVTGAAVTKNQILKNFEKKELQIQTLSEAVNAAADGNWGLSFQEEGKTPVGNATREYLQQ